MTAERLAEAMGAWWLALVYRTPLSPELIDLYAIVLSDLTDDELDRASVGILRGEKYVPEPATVLRYARPEEATEAARALDAIVACSDYDPHSGTYWSARRIERELGTLAAAAFRAAGGSRSFRLLADEYHGPGVRREFLAAYRDIAKHHPELRALSAGRAGVLPAAQRALPSTTPERAP